MYLKDAGDYFQISGMLDEGKLKDAAKRAITLDTASRDNIPHPVWQLFLSVGEDCGV